MIDSRGKASFREGWYPTGYSRDATVGFQNHAEMFIIGRDTAYFFKPVSSFFVPGLDEDEKFEEIDSYISEEFACDPDDIITLITGCHGPVIVMPEEVLLAAGVKLPAWPEPVKMTPRKGRRLVLVA